MSAAAMIELTVDGKKVSVPAGTSVFDAARVNSIEIPTLCHQQNEKPVGVCRVCVVEVVGARVFTASCVRPVEPGMVVTTNSEKVKQARSTLVELLMADHPSPCARERQSGDCELEALAKQNGRLASRYAPMAARRGVDESSMSIGVDFDACILCDRCIRGCSEVRDNFVLGRMGKGATTRIAFDNNQPMGESSCVSCGECMVSCPTGALTNKIVNQTQIAAPGAESVALEQLQELPFFENVSGTFLSLNRNAVVKRRFKRGEVICREGEYGSTAFYILDGEARVSIASPIAHVKTKGAVKRFLGKLSSRLTQRQNDEREEETGQNWIHIDAPVDLNYENPVAILKAGDLFGEMTCMSLYPRSATVRAETDCTMLEMLRNVLDILQRNKNFRAQLDQSYRQRALDSHLRAVPIFAELTDEFIESLRDTVELLRFTPGQPICRQGELADSFYLVRIGFVKVSQTHPGGEMVLAYLSRGDYFGETGLLKGDVRTATCSALDHVEVVRINSDDFAKMNAEFPQVRQKLEATERERAKMNRDRLSMVSSTPLDSFLKQGLMEAQSLLLLDLDSCTRCDACVRACADAHDGVTRLVREGLRFDHYLVATSCRQCLDPLCMVGCPVGSIRRRNSLEVIIEDWCIGCGLCADNCPYGNINMHPFNVFADVPGAAGKKVAMVKQKATSCDLCSDFAEPSCVYACPHDAAHRVNPRQFFAGLLQKDSDSVPKE